MSNASPAGCAHTTPAATVGHAAAARPSASRRVEHRALAEPLINLRSADACDICMLPGFDTTDGMTERIVKSGA